MHNQPVKITVWQTSDGRQFEDATEAGRWESRLGAIEYLESEGHLRDAVAEDIVDTLLQRFDLLERMP